MNILDEDEILKQLFTDLKEKKSKVKEIQEQYDEPDLLDMDKFLEPPKPLTSQAQARSTQKINVATQRDGVKTDNQLVSRIDMQKVRPDNVQNSQQQRAEPKPKPKSPVKVQPKNKEELTESQRIQFERIMSQMTKEKTVGKGKTKKPFIS